MNKFELTQPVFSSDLLFDLTSANISLQAAKEEKAREQNALILAVRKNYYATLVAELQVGIEKDNVRYLEEALTIEKKRYEGLDAPALAVTQSAVASSNAVSLYYKSLKTFASAKNALIQSLGMEPSIADHLHLAEKNLPLLSIPLLQEKMQIAKKTFCPMDLAFLGTVREDRLQKSLTLFSEQELMHYVETALDQLPEVQLKKLAVEIEESALKKTYGQYFPEISTFVDYQKNAGDAGSRTFSEDNFSWAAGVKISWNLFDSFGRERKIKEASSKKIAANLRCKYTILQTKIAIRDTLFQIEDAIYELLHAENAVFLAEFAREQAKERLRIGKIRPLDYRDAVNELSQAKNLRNQAGYMLILAYYNLQYFLRANRNDE